MHLFAALPGLNVMGGNKDFIHSFITGGNIDLVPLHAGLRGVGLLRWMNKCRFCSVLEGFFVLPLFKSTLERLGICSDFGWRRNCERHSFKHPPDHGEAGFVKGSLGLFVQPDAANTVYWCQMKSLSFKLSLGVLFQRCMLWKSIIMKV